MTKKILILIFSIVLFVIASEFVLRISGNLFYSWWMHEGARPLTFEESEIERINDKVRVSSPDKDLLRILCVGDSWTFGYGAAPYLSYPAQLQDMLEKEFSHRYRVYNVGIPGCTSAQMRRNLPRFLERYKPDVVVLLIGKNDLVNPLPVDLLVLSEEKKEIGEYWKRQFFNLRVVKLFRLGIRGFIRWKNQLRYPEVATDQKALAKTYLDKSFETNNAGDQETSEKFLYQALRFDPSSEEAFLKLGFLYQSQRKFADAVSWYERLIKFNPYSQYREFLYRFLFLMYQDGNVPDEIRSRIPGILERIPSDHIFQNPGRPVMLKNEIILDAFRKNLMDAIEKANISGAEIIFHTYLGDGYKALNLIIEDIAGKKSIRCLSDQLYGESGDCFIPDGHPNGKGYRFIAERIFKVLAQTESK